MSKQLQLLTKVMATAVRDNMEDFHCKHLSDAQMKELNPLIRQAIYTTLLAAQMAKAGDEKAAEWIGYYGRRALEEREWEDSVPMGCLRDTQAEPPTFKTPAEIYSLPIFDLFLLKSAAPPRLQVATRLRTACHVNGIETVGQFMALSPAQIMEFRYVRSKTFIDMLLWIEENWGANIQGMADKLDIASPLGLQLFGEASTAVPPKVKSPINPVMSSDKLRALIQARMNGRPK